MLMILMLLLDFTSYKWDVERGKVDATIYNKPRIRKKMAYHRRPRYILPNY